MAEKTREILNESKFRFQKKYGQNFLINPAIPEKIAASVVAGGEDKELCILEIGAGAGALTVQLAKRYKKVCALEIDTSLTETLEKVLADVCNAEVVFADVMKTDITKLCAEKFGTSRVAVCANLPYYITTPIIMLLFDCGVRFESITVMVQKEVALRICSKPGDDDYGAFTAAVNYRSDAKRLFDVGKGNFYPIPKIDSSIVRFTPHDRFSGTDAKKVESVIRGAFSQRRKTLYNSLSSAFSDRLSKEDILSAIEDAGISPTVRAEELPVNIFIKLSENIYSKMQ